MHYILNEITAGIALSTWVFVAAAISTINSVSTHVLRQLSKTFIGLGKSPKGRRTDKQFVRAGQVFMGGGWHRVCFLNGGIMFLWQQYSDQCRS